eukprot:3559548-Prymnesium_polylepis.1
MGKSAAFTSPMLTKSVYVKAHDAPNAIAARASSLSAMHSATESTACVLTAGVARTDSVRGEVEALPGGAHGGCLQEGGGRLGYERRSVCALGLGEYSVPRRRGAQRWHRENQPREAHCTLCEPSFWALAMAT